MAPPHASASSIETDTETKHPIPVYARPPKRVQQLLVRATSSVLSLAFLGAVVVCTLARGCWPRRTHTERPFVHVERARAAARKNHRDVETGEGGGEEEDSLQCDVGYYARRAGLECETLLVETDDGFVLELQHVREKTLLPAEGNGRKYPVLLLHGLLQSSGAFCVNDDDSLAFVLVRNGFDVFLGDSRCGMRPRHVEYSTADAGMWAWTLEHMAVYDLPAFVNTVLRITSAPHLALCAHSQGTAQTFTALSTHGIPALGPKISVFCALAPAVYAGPLVTTSPFLRILRLLPPKAFTAVFGQHAFISAMLTAHRLTPPKLYGKLGYAVFAFLFGWTDTRWDRGLRNRFFRFAPVYVSAAAMRWWLGRASAFGVHGCIFREAEKGAAWFDVQCPPLALWVPARDGLVDGQKLLQRLQRHEPEARIVYSKVVDEYEHLDVIWALDVRETVFEEIVDVVRRQVREKGGWEMEGV